MTPPPFCSDGEDACPSPCLNGGTGHPQQAGGDRHRYARQLMPPVFQPNLRGAPDPLLIKPARGHVMQQGNISDHLLSVLILARDRHPPRPRPPRRDPLVPPPLPRPRRRAGHPRRHRRRPHRSRNPAASRQQPVDYVDGKVDQPRAGHRAAGRCRRSQGMYGCAASDLNPNLRLRVRLNTCLILSIYLEQYRTLPLHAPPG
jgi:hypothetical protein